MNGSARAVINLSPPCRAAVLAALAGALLISIWPNPLRAASPGDPPGAKPATSKPAAAKAAPAAKPAGGAQPTSDLDNQLLDGLPPAKQPPAKQSPAKQPPEKSPAPPAAADSPPVTPGPVLGGPDDDDPLYHIGEQMRLIERRLEAHRAGDDDTPALQAEIVAELARLIQKLEERQNSQQSPSDAKQPSPSSAAERKAVRQPGAAGDGKAGTAAANDKRPAKESTERMGKPDVHAADADAIRGLMKDVWGQLPAREREQMLQSPPEQFLPKYELLLEKYYKRLADEQKHQP